MTAKGKKTTASLRAGDRILITDDLSKASTRTGGQWHPSRVKTGATTAVVSHLDAIAGHRTRYDVVTDAGTVPNLSGSQTFLLAADDAAPSAVPTAVQRWRDIEQAATTPEMRACVAAGVENADDTMDEAERGVTDAVSGPFARGDETWCRLAISGYEELLDKGVFAHLNDVPPAASVGWVQFHPDGPRVHPDYAQPVQHGGYTYDMVGRLDLKVGDVYLDYGANVRVLELGAFQCTHPGHPRDHRWYGKVVGLTAEDRRRTYERPWGTALCLAYDRGVPRRREVPDEIPAEDTAPEDESVERAYAVQVGREFTAWETLSRGTAVGPAQQLARDVALRQAYPLDVDRWRVLVYASTDREYPPVCTYGLPEANRDGLYCAHGDDPRHNIAECPGRHA